MAVEKISELNKICQKPNYKKVGNWMVRHFERDAAIYLTWVLLHTPVTAHQVTFFSLLVAIAGGFFISRGDGVNFLIGAFLLQFWYLLDHVDGQIARYRKTASLEGLFFDYLMHHVVTFVFLFCVGWAWYTNSGNLKAIAIGYVAAISLAMIGILNDCRSKAIHSYILMTRALWSGDPRESVSQPVTQRKRASIFQKGFSLLHKSCEGHVVMNVLTVFSLIYFWKGEASFIFGLDGMGILVLYYASIATVVWITKLVDILNEGKLTKEFRRNFSQPAVFLKGLQ